MKTFLIVVTIIFSGSKLGFIAFDTLAESKQTSSYKSEKQQLLDSL